MERRPNDDRADEYFTLVESLLRLSQSLAHKLLVLFVLFVGCHVAKVILFLESSKLIRTFAHRKTYKSQ